jgi:protein-tyrosine phosphatase
MFGSWFSKLKNKVFGRKPRVLFVCTGNTCRSPMAMTLFRDLNRGKVDVDSAGVSPHPGDPASRNAVKAMEIRGLDLKQHRSKKITKELIDWADVVFAMTKSHMNAVKAISPNANVELVADAGISDPYGGDEKRYQQCAGELCDKLQGRKVERKHSI